MGIAQELGLEARDPVQIIEDRWAAWCVQEPALGVVADPTALPAWLERSRTKTTPGVFAEVNGVLYGLARLAAADGGDDADAALILAWVMLPAAITIAVGVQHLDPDDVDSIIASNLWILVRSFRHRVRSGDVAASIARDLKTVVLLEMGVQGPSTRLPVTTPVPPMLLDQQQAVEPVEVCPSVELAEVLDDGIAFGFIDPDQRDLLLDIVDGASEIPGRLRVGASGLFGLLSEEVADRVGRRYGIGVRQVRRRADKAIEALTRLVQGCAA